MDFAAELLTKAGSAAVGKEIVELWTEYSEGVSPAAKFLKDMDKMEMLLQAFEYEQSKPFYFYFLPPLPFLFYSPPPPFFFFFFFFFFFPLFSSHPPPSHPGEQRPRFLQEFFNGVTGKLHQEQGENRQISVSDFSCISFPVRQTHNRRGQGVVRVAKDFTRQAG